MLALSVDLCVNMYCTVYMGLGIHYSFCAISCEPMNKQAFGVWRVMFMTGATAAAETAAVRRLAAGERQEQQLQQGQQL